MSKKRWLVAALCAVVFAAVSAGSAFAGPPANPSCWGAASADFAQSAPGALGEHASSFETPRLGIGNVAELFTGTHQPGDLAAVLGFSCP